MEPDFDIANLVVFQTEDYQNLIQDGGRPSHPISRLLTIANDPGSFLDILQFWQTHPDDWAVFGRQWDRWVEFRDAQQHHRGKGPHYALKRYQNDCANLLLRYNINI